MPELIYLFLTISSKMKFYSHPASDNVSIKKKKLLI